MYKGSGKKYKGSSRGASATGQQQYRASDYSSDVYRSDEDDDVDSLYDDINSPDYYTGSGKNGFFTNQSSASTKPGGLNYYGAKSGNDRYYSTASNYSTGPTRNNNQFNTGSNYSSKHKGKDIPAYKLNKYQTIVLKVQIHCDACIKKVKKAIANIDGVESISVDHKLKRVSVTGYIDPKKVLKKVAKTGKCVELIGGSLGPKDQASSIASMPHQLLSNKLALMATPEHHRQIHHPAIASSLKPYTVQVEKSSRSNNIHNNAGMHNPHYPIQAAPQLRSDMDYIFSDDNAHSCSIM